MVKNLSNEGGQVWPVYLVVSVIVGLVIVSCATVDRVIVAPPSIPDAEFVGTESCEACHDEYTRGFATSHHAHLSLLGEDVEAVGCEACHGPGSIHVDSGGAYHTIVNPKDSSDACFQCHLDKQSQFHLPYQHPIQNGAVSCGDCHDPHQGTFATRIQGFAVRSGNQNCLQCHPEQRGPYVFEHEAMREGCTICHDPHGSVNAKMLTERNSNLCLKCHAQERSSDLMIGGLPHRFLAQRGTCWTAGCHEAVHGSHVSSSLRF